MEFFGQPVKFWITVAVAAMIKAMFSRYDSIKIGLASLLAAIFVPWLLTDAVIHWLEIERDAYLLPTAGLLAWSGEQIVKFVSALDPKTLIDLYRGRS